MDLGIQYHSKKQLDTICLLMEKQYTNLWRSVAKKQKKKKKKRRKTLFQFFQLCFLSLGPLVYPLISSGSSICGPLGFERQSKKQEMGHLRSRKGGREARHRGFEFISLSFRWLQLGSKEVFTWLLQISCVPFFFNGPPWIPSSLQ